MTVSGSITRTDLSLSDLTFGAGTGLSLFVDGLTPGRRRWRRATVGSPFVRGSFETAAVLDQTDDSQFRFRVRQSSEAALQTAVAALVDAVEQRTWVLQVTVGSTDWPSLTCTRADTEVLFDTAHIRSAVATVNVYTTHKPSTGAL